MKECRVNPICRLIIRGLLVTAIILNLSACGEKGQSAASGETFSRHAGAGNAISVSSKNNLLGVPAQDLPAPAVQAAGAEPVQLLHSVSPEAGSASGGQASPVQQVSAAAAKSSPAAVPSPGQKTVYLTFDDGPSAVTPEVLKILKQQDVKATFFVLGDQAASRPELINAIWEQGHAIGNHTYNHNYHDLYSSFTEFWRQIKQTEETVRVITGVRPQLVRAPGGTFGHFDATYFYLLKQAGYTVMDWTADSGDSSRRGVPSAEIVRNSVADLTSSRVILLLHDGSGHEQSAKALPAIIERYKAAGYQFEVLDAQSEPVQFRVSARATALQRSKPSTAWVSANIVPNAELFAPGKPLALEVGKLETKLTPGEYSIRSGQYYVPLRTAVERLGGEVGWDTATRSGRVVWNGRTLIVDSRQQRMLVVGPDGTEKSKTTSVQLLGSALWVPLRDLLEAAGHPPVEASVNAEERRVKAS
ncbi:polysaccharide deacetylase family protein [Paenibacillus sp. MMS20-IR301]|uniref:polysaccharide deacetylase n=1 Tax=Paenibacillus sp. MMS20-IR301 TaxID=2895946 RepID=UPI0028EC8F8A|nr:polysaccharide deacetylase family protein [Paenibacillus sp. MMS20-IR301]WNS41636.1 polysaccharide deacetylase family protein [Paenibacillus sp. MMS20-IR301]